jgi:hypothetical protein
MSDTSPPVHTSATRARQGRWGRHMVWVLLASTSLGALALLAAWAWNGHPTHAAQTIQPTPSSAPARAG